MKLLGGFLLALAAEAVSTRNCEDRCRASAENNAHRCNGLDGSALQECHLKLREYFNACVEENCSRKGDKPEKPEKPSNPCKQKCDKMGAAGKKKCGDDKKCQEQNTMFWKKCSAKCKPSCGDMCDKKAADGKKKCGDDEACMKKVSAMYKQCQGGCKCQAGCDKKAAEAKKDCDSKQCMEKITNGYKKCSAGCKYVQIFTLRC